MRRQPDLEREILLAIELHSEQSTPDLTGIDTSEAELHYHLTLLSEAGLIVAVDARTVNNLFAMIPVRLTMSGHEYLDTIRDSGVWVQTKKGAEAVGNTSLDVLRALAKGFVREKIRKHTGMDLDF